MNSQQLEPLYLAQHPQCNWSKTAQTQKISKRMSNTNTCTQTYIHSVCWRSTPTKAAPVKTNSLLYRTKGSWLGCIKFFFLRTVYKSFSNVVGALNTATFEWSKLLILFSWITFIIILKIKLYHHYFLYNNKMNSRSVEITTGLTSVVLDVMQLHGQLTGRYYKQGLWCPWSWWWWWCYSCLWLHGSWCSHT